MFRIAVVTSEFPVSAEPYRGSPEYQTVLALQRRAVVEVFCPISTYPRWRFFHPRSFYYRRVDPGYSPPDVRVQYIEYPAFPLLTRPINGNSCARRLLPYLEKARPDLVLSYWVYPDGYAALLLAEKLGVPIVVGARGFDLSRITDPFTYYLVKKTLKRVSFVLTVSEELRQRAIRFGVPAGSVRTIHNGCNSSVFRLAERTTARAELKINPNARLVLFIGRLDRLKGVQELLDAAARLIPSDPDFQVAYIGEGPMEGILRERASQAGFTDHVGFLGTRTPPEVARWLAAADLLCLPSYSEGCPNVVLEALSCGRPVVASDVGGIPELMDSRCGILIPPQDAPRLAQALAEALHRPWDEAAIAARFGRSWDNVAEETYQVCSAILESKAVTNPA